MAPPLRPRRPIEEMGGVRRGGADEHVETEKRDCGPRAPGTGLTVPGGCRLPRRVRTVASLAVVLVFAGLAPAVDDPTADCPPAGFERMTCLLAAAEARQACGPRSFEVKLDRLLRRVAQMVGRAERATGRGRARPAQVTIGRVDRQLETFDTRAQLLAFRGTLTAPCGAVVDTLLWRLRDAARALRDGTPPTTTSTTTTAPATTTLASLPGTTVPTTSTTTTTVPTCGNGRLDPGEQCDGTNLFGRTCKDLGFVGGTLACKDCLFDNRGCHE